MRRDIPTQFFQPARRVDTAHEQIHTFEAAAFSIAAASAGAIRSIKTTPLLTAAEGIEAMKKAGMSGYKAPTRAARA
jgi:hypothetical protein